MTAGSLRWRWQRTNKSLADSSNESAEKDETDGEGRVYDATVLKLKKNMGRPSSPSPSSLPLARTLALRRVFGQLAKKIDINRVEPECDSQRLPSRKSRYMMLLLSTPVDQVQDRRHPVQEAAKSRRKPFANTICFTRVILEDKKRPRAAALIRKKGNAPAVILETRAAPPPHHVPDRLPSLTVSLPPSPPSSVIMPIDPTHRSPKKPLLSFKTPRLYTSQGSQSDPQLRAQCVPSYSGRLHPDRNQNSPESTLQHCHLTDDEDDEIPLGMLHRRSIRKARSVSEVQVLSA